MRTKNSIGHFCAIFTILIWGTTFVFTKILLEKSSPIEILFFRFLLGTIALCFIYPKRLVINDKKRELIFAGAGLCGVTLYYLLENIALTYTLVSNVGVIVSAAPFFTAIVTFLFIKNSERPHINFFIGFAVAIVGIYLISFSGTLEITFNPFGDFLALTAAFVWAFYMLFTKKIGEYGYNVIQTTRRVFLYGLLFMIPALFIFDFQLNIENFKDPAYTANILFLGLGACAACFVTWNHAVNILGPVTTTVYIYAVPVITIITSAVVLGEKMTSQIIIGTSLTLAGLFISQLNSFIKKK